MLDFLEMSGIAYLFSSPLNFPSTDSIGLWKGLRTAVWTSFFAAKPTGKCAIFLRPPIPRSTPPRSHRSVARHFRLISAICYRLILACLRITHHKIVRYPTVMYSSSTADSGSQDQGIARKQHEPVLDLQLRCDTAIALYQRDGCVALQQESG